MSHHTPRWLPTTVVRLSKDSEGRSYHILCVCVIVTWAEVAITWVDDGHEEGASSEKEQSLEPSLGGQQAADHHTPDLLAGQEQISLCLDGQMAHNLLLLCTHGGEGNRTQAQFRHCANHTVV